MVVLIASNLNTRAKQKANVRQLPGLTLTLADSTLFDTGSLPLRPTVIVFFSTTCEYCSHEAREIGRHIGDFSKANFLFISSESLRSINQFITENKLAEFQGILFARISGDSAFDNFGPLVFPHLFIYNSERMLVHEFKGETKVEAILKHIE